MVFARGRIDPFPAVVPAIVPALFAVEFLRILPDTVVPEVLAVLSRLPPFVRVEGVVVMWSFC